MSISSMTGSGDFRTQEIQASWIVTEPLSDIRLCQYPLYTVPLGQTFGAQVLVVTGSATFSTGTLNIIKDIHTFDDEVEASKFINEIGEDNISSILERPAIRPDSTSYTITDVHLLNYPKVTIEFALQNATQERGFKVEIFASGSNGLYEIEKRALFNARGDLISDTFLRYFEIEADVE